MAGIAMMNATSMRRTGIPDGSINSTTATGGHGGRDHGPYAQEWRHEDRDLGHYPPERGDSYYEGPGSWQDRDRYERGRNVGNYGDRGRYEDPGEYGPRGGGYRSERQEGTYSRGQGYAERQYGPGQARNEDMWRDEPRYRDQERFGRGSMDHGYIGREEQDRRYQEDSRGPAGGGRGWQERERRAAYEDRWNDRHRRHDRDPYRDRPDWY